MNHMNPRDQILRKHNTITSDSARATSSADIATALFGSTTSGGYHRYNPDGHDEGVLVNKLNECISPKLRPTQPPINNSLQAIEGHRPEVTANGQPQTHKRASCLDAERPPQPSTRKIVTPTSWSQAREQKGYGGTQRGRGRRDCRGRGRNDGAVKGSLRGQRQQEFFDWRPSPCINALAETQQEKTDDSSGWSVSKIPLHRRTPRPPEGYDFSPPHPGFRRIAAWLDVLDENSTKGVGCSDLDNDPCPEDYAEGLSIFSTLSLGSRPPTPEDCLIAGDPSTAARRRRVQRVLHNQDRPEIPDAGGVKLMETVYDEARRKMNFVEVEDKW
ncbi:hypothetical protein GP486_002603 [Trichoglossum hirsutum]|uniref:Uncharacterized protein n=1 Tax=Trichoglossum hirsutum TaxID=265104 RepID=A0A9P8RRI2_9PEZI|nr:hypothetical protein GP486_002603 [Trichoglossum hirsutum]